MAQYVSSLASFSTGFYSVPGREYICLSLALVGLICLAMAAAALSHADEEGLARVRLERD
jgi:hypothetical protein